jgi:hypothetical protein
MKMVKNILFIVVVLIANLCNGMEPESKGWMGELKNSILGSVDQFFSYIKSEPPAPFNFVELPLEIQQHIISLLGQYSNATSLKEAGQAINALARTNKKLNLLMNEPQFCFDLIRFLARKFKTSDEDAARAVSTKEVQRQFSLQKKLYSFVHEKKWDKHKNDIQNLCRGGVDVNFTYKSGKTVLMYAAEKLDVQLFNFLLEQGADINFANNRGVTALMVAAESGSSYDSYAGFQKLIANHENFNINQQDAQGNTALMYALMTLHDDTRVVKSLIDLGADPELANFAGDTPLAYITKSWDLFDNKDAIIALLKQAIERKYENK